MVNLRRSHSGHHPTERCPPVVSDDMSTFASEVAEDGHHIAHRLGQRVSLHRFRLARGSEAPQIGRYDLEAGIDKSGHLISPQTSGIWEPMKQNDWSSLADYVEIDRYAVVVYPHNPSLADPCCHTQRRAVWKRPFMRQKPLQMRQSGTLTRMNHDLGLEAGYGARQGKSLPG